MDNQISYIIGTTFVAVGLLVWVFIMHMRVHLARYSVERRLRALSGQADMAVTDIELKVRLSDISFFDKTLRHARLTQKCGNLIAQAGLSWTVGHFFLLSGLCAATGYCCTQLFHLSLISVCFVSVFLGVLPLLHIMWRRIRRVRQFDEQLPDCLSLIATVLRAGLGLSTAMDIVGKEMPKPASDEFHKTFVEMQLGLDLQVALEHFISRVPTAELSLFSAAVIVQREVGGNLAEFLDKLQITIRERFKLKREIKTLTAQVRLSGWIVGLVPLIVGCLLLIINPSYIKILLDDPIGQKLLLSAMMLQVLGFVTMKKMTMIKI